MASGAGHGRESYPPIRSITECALYHFNLKLTCRSCGHVRVFQGHCLWWLFHRRRWDDHLDKAGDRFWCRPCWSKRCSKVKGPKIERVKEEPTGEPLPWPQEREWKRVVARYRS
jgi:hypothetical protein